MVQATTETTKTPKQPSDVEDKGIPKHVFTLKLLKRKDELGASLVYDVDVIKVGTFEVLPDDPLNPWKKYTFALKTKNGQKIFDINILNKKEADYFVATVTSYNKKDGQTKKLIDIEEFRIRCSSETPEEMARTLVAERYAKIPLRDRLFKNLFLEEER